VKLVDWIKGLSYIYIILVFNQHPS